MKMKYHLNRNQTKKKAGIIDQAKEQFTETKKKLFQYVADAIKKPLTKRQEKEIAEQIKKQQRKGELAAQRRLKDESEAAEIRRARQQREEENAKKNDKSER